jgi:hypothetical protein
MTQHQAETPNRVQQQIGQPGAERAAGIDDGMTTAGPWTTRVAGVIGHQDHAEIEREATADKPPGFAQQSGNPRCQWFAPRGFGDGATPG